MAAVPDHEWDNDGQLILTGSANAYVATTARKIKGYYEGLRICGRANFTNTGAATITVDEAGPVVLRKTGNAALVADDIVNGSYYDFVYDDANDVMQVMAAAVPTITAFARTLLNDTTAAEALATLTAAGQGKQTIWVPSSAMVVATGAGGPSRTNITIGDHVISVLSFAPTGFETASFQIAMPKSWNLGSISYEVVWRHAATATNFGTVWQLAAMSFSNDDALATSLVDGTFVTDTGGTTNDIYISPEATLTFTTPAPASGDVLFCRSARFGDDAADTLAIDAELIGFRIFYTTNAPNDA